MDYGGFLYLGPNYLGYNIFQDKITTSLRKLLICQIPCCKYDYCSIIKNRGFLNGLFVPQECKTNEPNMDT